MGDPSRRAGAHRGFPLRGIGETPSRPLAVGHAGRIERRMALSGRQFFPYPDLVAAMVRRRPPDYT